MLERQSIREPAQTVSIAVHDEDRSRRARMQLDTRFRYFHLTDFGDARVSQMIMPNGTSIRCALATNDDNKREACSFCVRPTWFPNWTYVTRRLRVEG